MPEVLTLVIVAVLGVVVGAVGVGASLLSERERRMEETVDVEDEGLSAEALAVLTAMPGIAMVIDSDDSIIRADATAYAKGLARGNALTHPAVIDLVQRVRAGGLSLTEEFQLPRSTISGSAVLDFEVHGAALPAGRVLLLAEDRTLQRRNESVRRDFAANVSHELKTPVGAIRLLAETIAEDPDDPEMIAHFAPRLCREADRLSALIQDIIDLSRIQAPDALDAPELVGIDSVVEVALSRQETTAETASITLIGPSAPTGAQVWGNRDMLITAVRNLLDNAVRYSQSGTRVSVGIDVRDQLVSISVVDSGIGISEDDQQRIFERFYRVDPARSRNTGGTGLGLSIVKHVASDHGGTVTVWSRPGRGSTFTLVLPLADDGGEDSGIEDGEDLDEVEAASADSPSGRGRSNATQDSRNDLQDAQRDSGPASHAHKGEQE